MDKVHFPKPEVKAIRSQKPVPVPVAVPAVHTPQGRFKSMQQDGQRKVRLYQAIRNKCVAEGFGVGAVVCRRYSEAAPALNPKNWGIVVSHNRWHQDESKFKPLEVEWIQKGTPTTTQDMDELYLIHAGVTDQELRLVIDSQEKFEVPDELDEYGGC